MEISKAKWQIKDTCPDCGQGYPTFYYCPNCGYVTVMCEETGDTFISPKQLKDGFTDNCPKCGKVKTVDFETADSDQIDKAGFQTSDYQ